MSVDADEISPEWLAGEISERSAQGIAAAVSRLIRQQEISAGSRLPTVRRLAPFLQVSPATVSAAWTTLRRQRAVRGEGRQGTWVIGPPAAPKPARYGDLGDYWGTKPLDLTLAAPDPALLPDIRPAVAAATGTHALSSYDRSPISPRLLAAVQPSWPWPAEAFMAVNGGYEGLQLLLQSVVVPGDQIAIAEPSTPRTLDILDRLGARRIPVATDGHGPLPGALEAALRTGPVAFVYEPRASSGMGSALSAERARELAAVVPNSLLVIEDDGVGEVSSFPYEGLAMLVPEQTAVVRSYSKSHGPDLRLAVIAGPQDSIDRAHTTRQFGSGWTSRLLQDTLAWLLDDDASRAQVQLATVVYRKRRERLTALVADQHVQVPNRDGLAIWLPVADETQALIALASHGIAAIPGSRFRTRSAAPAVRVAACHDLSDPEYVATALVKASRVLG